MAQNSRTLVLMAMALLAMCAQAKAKKAKTVQQETLGAYVERMQQQAPDLRPATPGSLWTDNGRFSAAAGDYKGSHVGDLITIVVVQDVSAQSAGNVSTNRSFNASSGITGLAGHISTSGVQNILTPASSETLAGKSQAATTSSLRTRLAGRIVTVLPNGVMVVEAERQVTMNNERQTIVLRGLVRPGDVAPDNTVPSNAIADLQLELKGKGVLSDGVRPPNFWTRWLMRLVGF